MNPFHLFGHVLAHQVPHLVKYGLEKYGEAKGRRRTQQEQGMGQLLSTHYPLIQKAAEELRRREPRLTKEQAIARATMDRMAMLSREENTGHAERMFSSTLRGLRDPWRAAGMNATEAAKRKAGKLGVDLSRLRGSGAGGLITMKDVVNADRRGS